eukprot:2738033-Ditylum_brightwellii.AAC.1
MNEKYVADLQSMLFFMRKAKKRVSMNFITYSCPTHVYRLDSCQRGLGRYSHEGWAWRFYLSDYLQFSAPNNLLEHIMAIITPRIDVISGKLKRGDCLLSMMTSSTLEGWLKKLNLSELKD